MANDPNETIEVELKAKDSTAPAFKSSKEALIALRTVQIQVAQATLKSKTADDLLKQSKFQLKAAIDSTRLSLMAQKVANQTAAVAARKLATEQKQAEQAQKDAAKSTDKQADSTKKATGATSDFDKKLLQLGQNGAKRAEAGLKSLAQRVSQLHVALPSIPFPSARKGFNEIGSTASASAAKLEGFVKSALRLANIVPLMRSVGSAFSSIFGKLGNLPSFSAGTLEGGLGKLGEAFQKVASGGLHAFTTSLASSGQASQNVVSSGIRPLNSQLKATDSILLKVAGGSLRGLGAALAQVATAARIGITVLAQMLVAVKGLPNPLSLVTGAIGGIVDGLGRIGLAANGVKAITSSIMAMANGLTKNNASLEMTTVSMNTFLGSADATQKMLKQLSSLAMISPFSERQLQDTAKSLLSMKFEAAQIVPLLTAVGNAVAAMGTGNEGIDRITLALEQMQAKGRVQGDELMQLMEAGLPALQMLAAGFGVTTEQMNKMVEQGVVPADKAIAILIDQMNARYPDMMKVQSNTFNGMLSNLQDWAYQTSLILTKPFFEPAKRALKAFLDYVTSPAGQRAVSDLADHIQHAVDRMTAAFDRLQPKIKPFIQNLTLSARLLISQYSYVATHILPTLQALINQFTSLTLVILKVRYAFSPFSILLSTINGFLKGGLAGGIAAFKARLNELHVYVGNALKLVRDVLAKYGPGISKWLEDTASLLAKKAVVLGESLVNWVGPLLPKLLANLLDLGSSLLDWIVVYSPVVAEKVLTWGIAFIQWVSPYAAKLLERLEGLATNLLSWITTKSPVFLDKLKTWGIAFVDWLIPIAGKIARKLLELITTILNWVKDHADEILNQFATWAESFVSWILPMIPKIVEALGGVLNKIILWVITAAPRILTALLKWVESFIDWVSPMVGQVMANLRDLIDVLLRWVSQNAPRIVNQLLDWALAFLKWISPLIPLLINALARVISSILNWIQANAPALLDMVLTWVNQFLLAFDSLLPQILAALGVVIQALLTWIFDHGPDILVMLVNWAIQFLDWALGLFDALKPNLEVFINRVLQWLVSKGPELLDKMWSWIQQGLGIVMQLFTYIQPVLFQLISMLANWIRTNATDILDKFWAFFSMGLDLATKLMKFIEPVLGDIIVKVGEWITANANDILDKFWNFFSAGLDVVASIAKKLEPTLSALIVKIGEWITANASDILDKFWDFFKAGVTLIKKIMEKVAPVLVAIVAEIGAWVTRNAETIVKDFFGFFDWIVNNAAKVLVLVTPPAIKMMTAIIDAMVDQAPDLITKLVEGLTDSIQKNPEAWATIGTMMIGYMFGPLGIASAVMIEYLRKKSEGMVKGYAPAAPTGGGLGSLQPGMPGQIPGIPQKAMGDSSFKGGNVLWGEAGWERMKIPGGPELYASGPVYMPEGPAGSKFTPARDMPGGGTREIHIHNHMTFTGQPDNAVLVQIDRRVEEGVKKGIAKLKGEAQNLRTVNRTRG